MKLSTAVSALRFLALVVLISAISEVFVLFVLLSLPWHLSRLGEAVVDASILACVIAPLLYWFAITPYKRAVTAEVENFRTLLDSSPDAIIGASGDGRIRFANARALNVFEYAHAELVGLSVTRVISKQSTENDCSGGTSLDFASGTGYRGVDEHLYGRRKNGSVFPISINSTQVKTGEEELFLTAIRDITKQIDARNEVLDANRRLNEQIKVVERHAHEGEQLNEMAEMLQACNNIEEACDISSHFGSHLFPSTAGSICLISPSKDDVEQKACWGKSSFAQVVYSPNHCWALRRGRVYIGDPDGLGGRCQHLDEQFRGSYLCIPLLAQGEALGVFHLFKEMSDAETVHADWVAATHRLAISFGDQIGLAFANLRLRETLRNQSIRDPLTGLYNRRFVEEWLHREIPRARRNETNIVAIMLDLDHFKHFNDTFGHDGGDLVLRQISSCLLKQIREGDIACRLGGEEFAVLMPGTALDVGFRRAETIRKETELLAVRLNGQALGKITVSAGVAAFPEHGSCAEQLFTAADDALYRAKAEGRNRVIVA